LRSSFSFDPDESGLRQWYNAGTCAAKPSLPEIPELGTYLGRICLTCKRAYPAGKSIRKHVREEHQVKFGLGENSYSLLGTGKVSKETFSMQCLHRTDRKYFVVPTAQPSKSLSASSLQQHQADEKFVALQSELAKKDIIGSKILGSFICTKETCGCENRRIFELTSGRNMECHFNKSKI